jgi:hypothetical protein
MKQNLCAIICRILALYLLSASAYAGEAIPADVVVYGGTAGGVMASIAAARHGAKVVLVEPGRHVGGMVSGGLGHTDMDRQERIIGGLALDFFRRVGRHYGTNVAWSFEPHVAEQTMNAMLSEAKVPVRFGQRLASVVKEAGRIRALKTTDGAEFSARVFIDASYEGDLMKAAGVSYTVGREGRERYNESLAGRRELLPGRHQFNCAISPWKDGRLLPYITPEEKLVPTGAADGKFQSYCFRLCLTDVAENRLPVPRPEGYDPSRYELLRRYLAVNGEKVPGVLGISRLPNGKCDANSSGPISTDLLGANQDYPEGTAERRARIWEEHRSWAHGLLYYLQNDPGVPAKLRGEYARWGLCKDEFPDTAGWPHQLYIREARRMTGDYVLTQHDLMTNRRKPDCIGMAGYNIDIREVQWVSVRTFYFPKAEDQVYMEGYVSQPVEPWDIPYRALLPQLSQCQNLLVPVCASASTVAYASFRMEPQYMIAGHAAGVAAALASRQGLLDVHHVPIPELQRLLREDGQVLDLPDSK